MAENQTINKYKIKLRAKGDRVIHRKNFNKMSFKVDIKGNKKYKKMEEFSIQLPVVRGYTKELLAAKLTKSSGIITPKQFYVRFFINGKYSGIRHIEEGMGRELLENNNHNYGPIFSLDEFLTDNIDKSNFDLADKKYWFNQESNKVKKSLSILEAFKESKNYYVAKNYFDMKLWSVYFALMELLQTYHGAYAKSVKFYFNPETNLIEPIFFDGQGHQTKDILQISKLIGKTFNNYPYQSGKFKECVLYCEVNGEPFKKKENFLKKFFGDSNNINTDFYINYFNILEKYSSTTEGRKSIYNAWLSFSHERGELYKALSKQSNINGEGLWPYISQWYNIEKNLEEIKYFIYKSKNIEPKFSHNENTNYLYIKNNYSTIPQILSLKCDENSSKSIILIQNIETKFNIDKLENCNIKKLYFSLNQFQTKKLVRNSYLTDKLIEIKLKD